MGLSSKCIYKEQGPICNLKISIIKFWYIQNRTFLLVPKESPGVAFRKSGFSISEEASEWKFGLPLVQPEIQVMAATS
jgi:hypothetical protein